MNLQPYRFKEHFEALEHDENIELGLYNCIECGCCSYICPSSIDLLGIIRSDKNGITPDVVAEEKADEELNTDESPEVDEEAENDSAACDIPETEPTADENEEKEDLTSITDVDSYPEANKTVDDFDADLGEKLGNLLLQNESDSEEDEDNDADE